MESQSTLNSEETENLINELENLRQSNPDLFIQAMQALGLGLDEESKPSSSVPTGNFSIAQVTEAIKSMRSGATDANKLSDLLTKPAAQKTGKTVTPESGFSFKSNSLGDGMKVFINICQHEDIDVPAMKKKLNDEGEEIEGMNIPMSVGAPRSDTDKAGLACRIYDIIVNPVVIKEVQEDKTGKYRDFICQLGIQCLEQKYQEVLDKRYKLPKLKYMGEIQSQLIQDRKNSPKIEEISSTSNKLNKNDNKKTKPSIVPIEKSEVDLNYKLYWLKNKSDTVIDDFDIECIVNNIDKLYKEMIDSIVANEYVEPTHVVDKSTVAILLTAEIDSYDRSENNPNVKLSPYKISIKLPGYKSTLIYLPSVIVPICCDCFTSPLEGYVSKFVFKIILLVDHRSWDSLPDCGSKVWLVSQALSNDGDSNSNDNNPYYIDGINSTSNNNNTNNNITEGVNTDDLLPEDRFHIKLPNNVDPYTGLKLDYDPSVPENNELPEDKFHKKDAASSFLINQRDQAKQDKWDKYNKEKAERANDPNVEYVEMDDFKPGGKHGPKKVETEQQYFETAEDLCLKKAAELVATSVQDNKLEESFSSKLWAELL